MNEQMEAVWERRLTDGLHSLAESEAPATTVALLEVIASGHILIRLRRRTHRIFALSAVLIVLLALTVGVALADGQDGVCAPPAGFPPSPGFSIGAAGDTASAIFAFRIAAAEAAYPASGEGIGSIVFGRSLSWLGANPAA